MSCSFSRLPLVYNHLLNEYFVRVEWTTAGLHDANTKLYGREAVRAN